MYIVIISKLHLHGSLNSILMLKTVNNILIELRVASLSLSPSIYLDYPNQAKISG